MKIDYRKLLWTFGNHEPVTMYRRIGNKCTGGVEGGALWLEEWHNWYDSDDCASAMAELGFNILHCRFYKGMGWDFEKADFPRVKAFAQRCRARGIKVLAYVQYSTLYPEIMREEIPDLDSWAALDSRGNKIPYNFEPSQYFRWMPCVNNPDFQAYLRKIIMIAVSEKVFDGILFDNCHAARCYCPLCRELFKSRLKEKCSPEGFGLRSFENIECPPEIVCQAKEIKDPMVREWLRFRSDCNHASLKGLYDFIKSLNPDMIASGNVCNIHRNTAFPEMGMGFDTFKDSFDIIMSQSNNQPQLDGGAIINRVREMALAEAFGGVIFPLSDMDASTGSSAGDNLYIAGLAEPLVFGGIAADRVTMSPPRGGKINSALKTKNAHLLKRFSELADGFEKNFQGNVHAPVALLYSKNSQQLSDSARNALFSAEEVLLRNHIPFRIAVLDNGALCGMGDSKVLIAAGQSCLSQEDISALKESGAILIADKSAGDCDENNRQRAENPLKDAVIIPELKTRVLDGNYRMRILPPENPEALLSALLSKIKLKYEISAPEDVFIKIFEDGKKTHIHFVDYSGADRSGLSVRFVKKPSKLFWTDFYQTQVEISAPPALRGWGVFTAEF